MDENTLQFGWFTRGEGEFLPLPLATSLWSTRQMHGVAVSGLLALALEEHLSVLGRTDLTPARYRVDLFRPAEMVACATTVTMVREGPRLVLLDAHLTQADTVVARASALFLRPGEDPAGEIWSPTDRAVPPDPAVLPPAGEHHVPFFASQQPWSQQFGEHQNPGRHTTWQTAVPIVPDEEVTPFQAVASIADATSMVTNWGTEGISYINTDVDLVLARRPDSVMLGIRATDHVAHAGIAVGTAEVFDRTGPIGTATVTALANSRRTVDLGGPENPVNAPEGV